MPNRPEPPLFQTHFPPEEFAERRAKVFDAIGPEAIALVQGEPKVHGSETFRQGNVFYYLCGIEIPQSYLLLDARNRKTVVFIPEADIVHAKGEGPALVAQSPETIATLSGVDEVCGHDALAAHLTEAKAVFVPRDPPERRMATRSGVRSGDRAIALDPWDGRLPRYERFIDLLQARFPRITIENLSPIIDGLRLIKSPREIELLRRAGRLSALAVTEAMRSTQPGVMEYHLGAIADYVFRVNGARGESYHHIIAGGPNIHFGHYSRLDSPLQDGDLLLMDGAPDYAYYTSDIGRMFPINGTFSPLHRELYGFVIDYHKAILKRIRPGVTAEDIQIDAAAEMAAVIEMTPFSKPIYEAAARRMLEFRGHLSHPVGMTVHDVGNYRAQPLRAGTVFTVDPQMWIPEESGYIRCEDTVTVTDDGLENFTASAPLEFDDVEAEMRKPGLLQARPPVYGGPSA